MNVQILIPSQINHPTIHITGNDPKLGNFNYGQSIPLIYSGDGWHLSTKIETRYLFYKYISYANPPNLIRFCAIQNKLILIDEEKISPDQLAYSEPIDILLLKSHVTEIDPIKFVQEKPFCIFVFVPFLPQNSKLVISCQKTNWIDQIEMKHFGHRFFGVQLDENIGEFKFCIQHSSGELEWEGMFNRILRGQPPSWHNMFFNHTKRYLFKYQGLDFSQIDSLDLIKDKIEQNITRGDFFIIDPFIEGSQCVFRFNNNLKSPDDIIQQLNCFFSSDIIDSFVISSTTFMFLKRYIIQTFRYDVFDINNPQTCQKLLRDLFWNQNNHVTQKQHDFMLNFAWNQCIILQQIQELKQELQSMNKLLIIKQSQSNQKDLYLSHFDFDLIKFYNIFSHISLNNQFRIYDEFIEARLENKIIFLQDQFELEIIEE